MPAIRSSTSPTFTAPDVAAAVMRLEGECCTPRRVRNLLGELAGESGTQRRRTRPFGLLDVALMRLAVRLEAQGVSAWVVRVLLAYCGDEIREAWRAQKQDELKSLLQMAIQSGDAESARAIQLQLAELTPQVQREGIGADLSKYAAYLNALASNSVMA